MGAMEVFLLLSCLQLDLVFMLVKRKGLWGGELGRQWGAQRR